MLRIVLLYCLAHSAWTESQREDCDSLPSLLERIADKDDVSLAAQCRRQFGLKDCEQMILSVGKGPWTQQVREKACNKIANLLASRNLMDTPLDKVTEHKLTPDEATAEDRHSAPALPPAPPLATAPPVVLATAPPVALATVAPVVAAAAAETAAQTAAAVEKAGEEALKSAGHEVSKEVKAATPGLLNALGDTFVGASAQLTPEQRREGQENEDRPSWLAASAAHPPAAPADAAKAAANAARAVASTATADALRGAGNALKSVGADSKEKQSAEEQQPSWKKEESFHERMETNEKKGPFGIDLGDFVSSHANQDPNAAPQGGSSNGESEEWMEDKFDLRDQVAERINTHKMLSWAFIFVALVSLFSSLIIRWRPSAGPTAYSRLEAQVPFSSSRQVRVSSTSRCPEPL